jgi:hypothetical protein
VNDTTAHHLGRLIVIGMIVQLSVICYVFYSAYERRKEAVVYQRAGCERSKLDRGDNASGWRIAEAARRADGQIEVANEYDKIASSLEARSRIACSKAFPDATIFP